MPRPSIEPTLIDQLRVCMSAASRLATATLAQVIAVVGDGSEEGM